MLNFLFRAPAETDDAGETAGLRARYDSWRFRRDIAAITATLDRLSDRRLEMIGMRRDELFEAVSDLMIRAEEERSIGREVMELLEKPLAGETAPSAAEIDASSEPGARVANAA
ncbi:hypothetical protein ROJ8625_00312 [Roseivivax jejudonensis]|uniref:Uncharacterized protein n=1 Tax=Roseivivax jejudonensis TaxID=1529041 RepID=A0A1X6Y6H6_9RHOB|nr:hypothetical protein [Roseivivax jejudonensis]SLN12091.1 hypothetical protein ROJ8625_00312 [Roseivivax jejudonensis]